MKNWDRQRVLALITFSAILIAVSFQNCSKVGVQDLGSQDQKISAEGLVIGDENREVVSIIDDEEGNPVVTIPSQDNTPSEPIVDHQPQQQPVACISKLELAEEAGSSCRPDSKNPCVLVCHVPPGNSANRHNIVVGMNASFAHMDHGDYLGPCDSLREQESPSAICEDQQSVASAEEIHGKAAEHGGGKKK